jgi:hypothetical protein
VWQMQSATKRQTGACSAFLSAVLRGIDLPSAHFSCGSVQTRKNLAARDTLR